MKMTLRMKLGSLIVHAEELLSPNGSLEFDGNAIRTILVDPEVKEFLDSVPAVMLPVKRATTEGKTE